MVSEKVVLDLLLADIKLHMDEQIEAAKKELEETRQLKAELDFKLFDTPIDRWSEYFTIAPDTAYMRLRRRTDRSITDQLDDIAAEG